MTDVVKVQDYAHLVGPDGDWTEAIQAAIDEARRRASVADPSDGER